MNDIFSHFENFTVGDNKHSTNTLSVIDRFSFEIKSTHTPFGNGIVYNLRASLKTLQFSKVLNFHYF